MIKTETSQLLTQARSEFDRIGKITHETFQKLRAMNLSPLTLEQVWTQEAA